MEHSHNSEFDLNPAGQAAETESISANPPQTDHKKMFLKGIRCLGAGVLLMGLSFAINMLFFHESHDFTLPMYTLTSVGALLIMGGIGCIMGF